MLLNVVLLLLTIMFIYFGYAYKSFVVFFISLVFESFYEKIHKYKSYKAVKQKTNSIISFFVEDTEFTIIIPDRFLNQNDNKNDNKILAMYKGKNVTNFILKVIGPNFNFYGLCPTPFDLGFEDDYLYIWFNKTKYTFKPDDEINFTYPPRIYNSSDSESEDELSNE